MPEQTPPTAPRRILPGHDGTEKYLVTPQIAAGWLELYNWRNRPIKSNRIAAYVADMSRGSWIFNGESIKFGVDSGRVFMADGQNRCHAIVASQTAVVTNVTFGLEAVAQDTIDSNAVRSFADTLAMKKVPNAKATAAICNQIWFWSTAGPGKTGRSPSKAEAESLRLSIDGLEVDVDRYRRLGRALNRANSVFGLASYLFRLIDPDAAEDFMESLISGANLAPGHPALVLRNRLMADAAAKAHLGDKEVLAITIKAWNHYRSGKSTGALRWKTVGDTPEAFPLPI